MMIWHAFFYLNPLLSRHLLFVTILSLPSVLNRFCANGIPIRCCISSFKSFFFFSKINRTDTALDRSFPSDVTVKAWPSFPLLVVDSEVQSQNPKTADFILQSRAQTTDTLQKEQRVSLTLLSFKCFYLCDDNNVQ